MEKSNFCLLVSFDHKTKKSRSCFATCKSYQFRLSLPHGLKSVKDYLSYRLMVHDSKMFGFGYQIRERLMLEDFNVRVDGKKLNDSYHYTLSLMTHEKSIFSIEENSDVPFGFLEFPPEMDTPEGFPDTYSFRLEKFSYIFSFKDDIGTGFTSFMPSFDNCYLINHAVLGVDAFYASETKKIYAGTEDEKKEAIYKYPVYLRYGARSIVQALLPLIKYASRPEYSNRLKSYIDQYIDKRSLVLVIRMNLIAYEFYLSPLEPYMDKISKLISSDKMALLEDIITRMKGFESKWREVDDLPLHVLMYNLYELRTDLITDEGYKVVGEVYMAFKELETIIMEKWKERIDKIHSATRQVHDELGGAIIQHNPLFPHMIWRKDLESCNALMQQLTEHIYKSLVIQKCVSVKNSKKYASFDDVVFKHPCFTMTVESESEVKILLTTDNTGESNDKDIDSDMDSDSDEQPADCILAEMDGIDIFDTCMYVRMPLNNALVRVPLDGSMSKSQLGSHTCEIMDYKAMIGSSMKVHEYAVTPTLIAVVRDVDEEGLCVRLLQFSDKFDHFGQGWAFVGVFFDHAHDQVVHALRDLVV